MEKAKKNPFAGLSKWFRETKSELKKVVWPSFEKIRKNTGVVLTYVLIVGCIIWALDAVTIQIMRLITG